MSLSNMYTTVLHVSIRYTIELPNIIQLWFEELNALEVICAKWFSLFSSLSLNCKFAEDFKLVNLS